jgi:hypothetical protein
MRFDARLRSATITFRISETDKCARPGLITSWRQFQRLLERLTGFDEPILFNQQITKCGQSDGAARIAAGS